MRSLATGLTHTTLNRPRKLSGLELRTAPDCWMPRHMRGGAGLSGSKCNVLRMHCIYVTHARLQRRPETTMVASVDRVGHANGWSIRWQGRTQRRKVRHPCLRRRVGWAREKRMRVKCAGLVYNLKPHLGNTQTHSYICRSTHCA
jgi:hypothetical protein